MGSSPGSSPARRTRSKTDGGQLVKSTAFSLTSVAALAVVIGLPLATHAQSATPPNVPSDFSTVFVVNANQSTALSLLLGNAPGRAHSDRAHPGQEKGNLYEEFTNNRMRIDFLAPDGSPAQTYWFFYDKRRYFTLDYETRACTVTTGFDATMPPFFGWVADAVQTPETSQTLLLGDQSPVTITHWKYTPPEDSGIRWLDLGVATSTPVSLQLQPLHGPPLRVGFEIFNSGAPDASVFDLPEVCVE